MDSQSLINLQSAFPLDLKDQNASPLPSINIITPSKSVKSENDLSSTSESKSLVLNDQYDRYNRLPLSPASPMTMSGKKERLDIEAQKKQAEQNYNFVRQHLNKTDQLNDKFASFLKVLREKLEIPEGSFETVKDPILDRIGELLSLRKLLKEEREAKEKAIAEMQTQKENSKKQIEEFNKRMENVLEESQAFLQTDPFVFKKAALASIVHGMDMKDEEIAHVDKVLLNIKEKKVIVEYNIEAKDLIAQEHNRKMEENNRIFDGWDGNSRNLLKATRRLAKRFIKTNYLMLFNITDFYRFVRDKDSKHPGLTRIYTELDEKEKYLEVLNKLYEEKEAGNVKHFAVEFMGQMHKFLNEMTNWWDTNFRVMKEVYQELSKSTTYMITDLQDRLICELERKA